MPTDITISNINGQEPYDIYICDSGLTTCYYVNTINNSDFPFEFQVPTVFDGLYVYNVKAVDGNNCEVNNIVNT
jgi:hypothetical protein